MIQTIEESTEKRCCELTEQIIAKKDKMIEMGNANVVSEATIEQVNDMVENRVRELKKELPALVDYAKMRKMQECMNTIKECVGYKTDEQVERVAAESAKVLHSTKSLIETQAKTISEKSASLNESTRKINSLNEQIQQMKEKLEASQKQIVESMNKNKELILTNQNLAKKVEESKKINESIELKRRSESLKYYLESKIAQYPKYEASLLRKQFANAKSQAEIDENFPKALALVQERRDVMRSVQPIPVAKANESNATTNRISGGETIVKVDGGNAAFVSESVDDSFVDIDDNDVISNDEMQRWISRL